MARTRALVLIGSILAALPAFPTAAAAEPAGYSVSERGVSLDASWWFAPSPGARTYIDLNLFDGHRKSSVHGVFNGTEVCVRVFKFTRRTESSEKGCVAVPSESLIVAHDLSSARLKATRVDIYRCESWDPATRDEICDPNRSRRMRVSARWTATGPTRTQEERSHYDHDGYCETKIVIRGTSRPMEARGRLNGDSLGSTEDATIFDGLDKIWSTCPPL